MIIEEKNTKVDGLSLIANYNSINHRFSQTATKKDEMNFDLNKLVRNNIKKLKPYSSARSEFSGTAKIYLDANENSLGSPLTKWYNRYPDPFQWELKKKLS